MSMATVSRILFPLFFIAAGAIHFFKAQFYVQRIPPFVPYRFGLVIGAGVLEIALAVLAFFDGSRRYASLAIMGFLLCVIPVNLYTLISKGGESKLPNSVLWARVLFLSLLATWGYFNSTL
jgi:uncharacterized membrane protein